MDMVFYLSCLVLNILPWAGLILKQSASCLPQPRSQLPHVCNSASVPDTRKLTHNALRA